MLEIFGGKALEVDFLKWIFILLPGESNYAQSLDRQVGKIQSETISSIVYKNKVISAASRLVPFRLAESFVEVRVLNPDVAFPEVTVTHDISSWRVGRV